MKSEIEISKNILNWVIQQTENMDLSSDMKELLAKWLSDEKKPTYNQVEKMSRTTGIPLGYFFLETPPNEDLTIVEYRTVDSMELINPSRNLIETLKNMEFIQDWTRNYLSDSIDVLSYVGAMKNQENVIFIADFIRDVLQIDKNWNVLCRDAKEAFKFIRNRISDAGTIVMLNGIVGNNTRRILNINEFRAFALVDKIAPLIFINNNDSANGKLFSILHEFAHICMGVNSLYNDYSETNVNYKKTERICNAAAAELLLPTDDFINEWNEYNYDPKDIIIKISKNHCCSVVVTARKAVDNQLISNQLYNQLVSQTNLIFQQQKEKRDSSGGDFYRTTASRIDRNFLLYLSGSVSSGRTKYTDAFAMTNTNRKTYETLMKRIGAVQ